MTGKDQDRKAGEEAVTPEMVEAAAAVLVQSGLIGEATERWVVEELARDVLSAAFPPHSP